MFLRRIGFGHLSNADNHRIYIVTEDALLPYIYFRLICAFFFCGSFELTFSARIAQQGTDKAGWKVRLPN